MAVVIKDTCINCAACIDECPVEAIVDEDDNPTKREIYYVYEDKCTECVGKYSSVACADACPIPGCIVWGGVSTGMLSSQNRGKKGEPCIHLKKNTQTRMINSIHFPIEHYEIV